MRGTITPGNIIFQKELEVNAHTTEPVSYTHLDVYKRQALYGSRGSNGVVVITTKKGKKGEGKVSYDGWIGFQTYACLLYTSKAIDFLDKVRELDINHQGGQIHRNLCAV